MSGVPQCDLMVYLKEGSVPGLRCRGRKVACLASRVTRRCHGVPTVMTLSVRTVRPFVVIILTHVGPCSGNNLARCLSRPIL